jgi:hypothetical protein
MWLACHTQQEIADAVGVTDQTIANEVETLNLEALPKLEKLAALHEDADWSRRPQERRRGTRWAADREQATAVWPNRWGRVTIPLRQCVMAYRKVGKLPTLHFERTHAPGS